MPAVNPLVLEDGKTGEKLYDARAKKHGDAHSSYQEGLKAVTKRARTPQEADQLQAKYSIDYINRKAHKITGGERQIASRDTTSSDTRGPLTQDTKLTLPDYKSLSSPFGPAAIMARTVEVKFGPADNGAIEHRMQQLLHGRDFEKLYDFDKEKLQNLAICDVFLDKYQEALSKLEMKDAGAMPVQLRGGYLAGAALEDGAALGATRQVLRKCIDEGALGDLSSGTAIGIALGKVVAKLAAGINPWTRGAAILLQAGGVGLLAKQVLDIGDGCIKGLNNSGPALQNLINDPSEANLAEAKSKVDEQLGGPLADGALVAVGFAAAHGVEKVAMRATKSGVPQEKTGIKSKETNEAESRRAELTLLKDFSIEGGSQYNFRMLNFDDQKVGLYKQGSFFFGKFTTKGFKSPIKLHVMTDSPEDLHQLQKALIPECEQPR